MGRKIIVSDCFVMVIIIFVIVNIHESCFDIQAEKGRPKGLATLNLDRGAAGRTFDQSSHYLQQTKL